MDQAYSNELRADTATILIPIIAGLTATGTLLAALAHEDFATGWHFWLSVVLAIVGGAFGWRALKQNRQMLGTILFTAVHLLIFFLLIFNFHKNIQ